MSVPLAPASNLVHSNAGQRIARQSKESRVVNNHTSSLVPGFDEPILDAESQVWDDDDDEQVETVFIEDPSSFLGNPEEEYRSNLRLSQQGEVYDSATHPLSRISYCVRKKLQFNSSAARQKNVTAPNKSKTQNSTVFSEHFKDVIARAVTALISRGTTSKIGMFLVCAIVVLLFGVEIHFINSYRSLSMLKAEVTSLLTTNNETVSEGQITTTMTDFLQEFETLKINASRAETANLLIVTENLRLKSNYMSDGLKTELFGVNDALRQTLQIEVKESSMMKKTITALLAEIDDLKSRDCSLTTTYSEAPAEYLGNLHADARTIVSISDNLSGSVVALRSQALLIRYECEQFDTLLQDFSKDCHVIYEKLSGALVAPTSRFSHSAIKLEHTVENLQQITIALVQVLEKHQNKASTIETQLTNVSTLKANECGNGNVDAILTSLNDRIDFLVGEVNRYQQKYEDMKTQCSTDRS